MRLTLGLILLVVITVLFSCEEMRIVAVDCDKCSKDDLEMVNITIKVDNTYGQSIIKIYDGNLEDNIVYATFNTIAKVTYSKVPVNKKYTVTATYFPPGNDIYVAVDDIIPRVRYDKYSCEEPCYYPYDNIADLRLKYLK